MTLILSMHMRRPCFSLCVHEDPDSWTTLKDALSARDSDSQLSAHAHGDSDSRHAIGDSDSQCTHVGTVSQHTCVGILILGMCAKPHGAPVIPILGTGTWEL